MRICQLKYFLPSLLSVLLAIPAIAMEPNNPKSGATEYTMPEPERKVPEAEYKTTAPDDLAGRPRPQDNFFEYVHGKWSKDTCELLINQVQNTIHKQLKQCLGNTLARSSGEDIINSPENRIRDGIYKLYTSLTDNRKENLEAIQSTIRKEFILIDSITKKSEIPIVIGHLNSINVTAFITPKIEVRIFNPLKMYLTPSVQKTSITTEYIKNIFKTSGIFEVDDKMANNIKKIIVLTQKIADDSNEMRPNTGYRDVYYEAFPVYNTPKDLLRWVSYFDTAELRDKIQFVMYPPTYFRLLNNKLGLLSNDSVWSTSPSLASLKAYLKFELLSTYLDKYNLDILLKTPNKLKKIHENATSAIMQNIPDFLRLCFETNEPEINKLIDGVKISYKKMIQNTPFMTEETKKNVLIRLANISWYIKSYPPQLPVPLPNKELTTIDPMANLKLIHTYYYQQYIDRLGRKYDDLQFWLDNTKNESGQSIGSYSSNYPGIFVGFGNLTFPFFEIGNDTINYSGLVFTLGHELGHALQPVQYKNFDEEDFQWMDKNASDHFEKVARQLNRDPFSSDNILSVSYEEIADSIGIRIAYDAYNTLLVDRGITINTPEWKIKMQQFFYNFAKSMYADRKDCNYNDITNLTHPRSDTRINKVLSHMDEFYKVYDVKPGNGMYLIPEERIKVW